MPKKIDPKVEGQVIEVSKTPSSVTAFRRRSFFFRIPKPKISKGLAYGDFTGIWLFSRRVITKFLFEVTGIGLGQTCCEQGSACVPGSSGSITCPILLITAFTDAWDTFTKWATSFWLGGFYFWVKRSILLTIRGVATLQGCRFIGDSWPLALKIRRLPTLLIIWDTVRWEMTILSRLRVSTIDLWLDPALESPITWPSTLGSIFLGMVQLFWEKKILECS